MDFEGEKITILAVAAILVILSLLFPSEQGLAMTVSLLMVPVFVVLGLDCRIPFAAGLLGISLGILAIFFDDGMARAFSIPGYWLLASGVLCMVINHLMKREGALS